MIHLKNSLRNIVLLSSLVLGTTVLQAGVLQIELDPRQSDFPSCQKDVALEHHLRVGEHVWHHNKDDFAIGDPRAGVWAGASAMTTKIEVNGAKEITRIAFLFRGVDTSLEEESWIVLDNKSLREEKSTCVNTRKSPDKSDFFKIRFARQKSNGKKSMDYFGLSVNSNNRLFFETRFKENPLYSILKKAKGAFISTPYKRGSASQFAEPLL